MDFTLRRNAFRSDGIFGELYDHNDMHFCFTLEHAFPAGTDPYTYVPLIPVGEYVCRRRKSPKFGYDLFMLIGVPGHTYLEIHIGNWNKDSDGCILLGLGLGKMLGGGQMITSSDQAFKAFMALLKGQNEFNLKVLVDE